MDSFLSTSNLSDRLEVVWGSSNLIFCHARRQSKVMKERVWNRSKPCQGSYSWIRLWLCGFRVTESGKCGVTVGNVGGDSSRRVQEVFIFLDLVMLREPTFRFADKLF